MVPPEMNYGISNQGSPPQIATYAREQHCGGHFVQTLASCSTQPYVQCASLGGVCPQSRMYDDPPSNMWAPPSQCGQPQSGSAHAPQAAQSSQCCAMAQMYAAGGHSPLHHPRCNGGGDRTPAPYGMLCPPCDSTVRSQPGIPASDRPVASGGAAPPSSAEVAVAELQGAPIVCRTDPPNALSTAAELVCAHGSGARSADEKSDSAASWGRVSYGVLCTGARLRRHDVSTGRD